MQISQRRTGLHFVIAFIVILASSFVSVHAQDPDETIRIDSDLVDLKVSVLGHSAKAIGQTLKQDDFAVYEDGKPQDIAFFAAADAPFDLVLLLDLSGSNSRKLKMLRNSAKRFVDAARPIDRIALVTFTDRPALYSSFTLDRKKLKKAIDQMDDASGGTNFWDALNYVLTEMVVQGPGSHRSAIVVMTDGIDNALEGVPGPGSMITFEALLQNIRDSESVIFPIYLDTESEIVKDYKRFHVSSENFATARQQLSEIATICATNVYKAAKLTDLDQVYDQVIRDLSTVYSIGYRPSNTFLDGKWRSVEVKIPQHPDLFARTRRGYFAKLDSETATPPGNQK
ncbi:MAG TPA: VWA domain-containing protein [Pyrinomonadaceae bacterium]